MPDMEKRADKFALRLVAYFQGRNAPLEPCWQPLREELRRRILREFRAIRDDMKGYIPRKRNA